MKRREWFKPAVLLSLAAFCISISGCAKAAAEYKRKPIYDDLTVVDIPPKLKKKTWPNGTILPITKDQAAPMPGILFSEKRAKSVAELRIEYDRLYDVASINRKFTLSVLKEADNQLRKADAKIQKLEAQRNSWWNRNRNWILILTGSVTTLVLGGLAVWGVSELKGSN